jgi:hypothetical protein
VQIEGIAPCGIRGGRCSNLHLRTRNSALVKEEVFRIVDGDSIMNAKHLTIVELLAQPIVSVLVA